jgi:ferritin
MSYSRWGGSVWYSFYNCSSGNTRDTQVLSLWYSMDHIIDWLYEDLHDVTAASIVEMYKCTDAEAAEAMQIIGWFMADVEEDYPDAMQILDKIDKIGEPR